MLQRYTAKSIRQSDLEKTLCSSFKLPFIKHILCVSHPQFFGAADLTDKLCPQKLQSSRGDRRTKRLGEQVKRKEDKDGFLEEVTGFEFGRGKMKQGNQSAAAPRNGKQGVQRHGGQKEHGVPGRGM